mmetsp:Transcript_33002/g.53354  ORF Transcript_33002/g.53354 Transcript_33002/m.53354 type:complete len:155 (+) Transcript_33002:3-467(+)
MIEKRVWRTLMKKKKKPSPPYDMLQETIRREILRLATARGFEKTLCPSEVARSVARQGEDWRALMEPVRCVGRELVQEGFIIFMQRGQEIDAFGEVRGPIRFRLSLTAPPASLHQHQYENLKQHQGILVIKKNISDDNDSKSDDNHDHNKNQGK